MAVYEITLKKIKITGLTDRASYHQSVYDDDIIVWWVQLLEVGWRAWLIILSSGVTVISSIVKYIGQRVTVFIALR